MTNHIAKVFNFFISRMILSLLVNSLFGMAVLVAQAAPSPEATLRQNAGKQNLQPNSSLTSSQKSYLAASGFINTSELQACAIYHFSNQSEDVGVDGVQPIAGITPPSAGSPTEISVDVDRNKFSEVARFYTHPSFPSAFNIFGDISGMVWVQTNTVNTVYRFEMFDYNPATGNTDLLGDFEIAIVSTGLNEVEFTISPSITTIEVGHRMLLVISARAPFSPGAPPPTTAKLYYNSADRDSRFTVCQLTPPTLTITKAGSSTAVAGQRITYTLTISNSGGLTATNLSISDTIPANATYVSGGTLNGNVITWSVDSLASNTTIDRVFVVTATQTITNDTYQVAADDNVSAIGQDNVVTVVSQPGQPNLAITKIGPATVAPNEPINYTLTVMNGGDVEASNLIVSDTIPTGATYVSGGTKVGNTVIWTAPSLAPAASLDFNFGVTATGTITNNDYRVVADGNVSAVGTELAMTAVIVKPSLAYLPLILSSGPETTLIIDSVNTGGINPLRVLDPDNNNTEVLRCTIGVTNDLYTCGTFPPIGNYKIVAHTGSCGILQGTFNDAAPNATVTRRVFCNN